MFAGNWRRLALKVLSGLKVCCRWEHLKATGSIALMVGTWLTLVNLSDVYAAQGLSGSLALKVAINYLTPFVVSNLGLISRKS